MDFQMLCIIIMRLCHNIVKKALFFEQRKENATDIQCGRYFVRIQIRKGI